MMIKSIVWSLAIGCVLGSQGGLAATTTRVSINSLGQDANSDSFLPAISADGRFVAFNSFASNLVTDDNNGTGDVFVHDRQTGETTRVSVNSLGQELSEGGSMPSISGKGRFVAFVSGFTEEEIDLRDVFVHDRQTGETTLVSVNSFGQEGNGRSVEPAISANGRFVAFNSNASNLVADDNNGIPDVFVHDRETSETTRVSINSIGEEMNEGQADLRPAISADGRFVAFHSGADNLVLNDTNFRVDIFVHDRETRETTRVSVNSLGQEGNGSSRVPAISADGRFVAFQSGATNLVPDDTNNLSDIFVHDRETGETTRVSVNSLGQETPPGVFGSRAPAISADGRFVTFRSGATNLVPDDTNRTDDVFVHDRETGETTRVSVDSFGQEVNPTFGAQGLAPISEEGRFVAFDFGASDLVPDDTNDRGDIFVRDRDRTIVNEGFAFEPNANTLQTLLDGEGCADDFVGRFMFDALLVNQSDAGLANLQVPVTDLTGGNKLLTAAGLVGPNGEFPVPERDEYSDGILGPGESVTVPFEVCLRERNKFRLFVNVAEDRVEE